MDIRKFMMGGGKGKGAPGGASPGKKTSPFFAGKPKTLADDPIEIADDDEDDFGAKTAARSPAASKPPPQPIDVDDPAASVPSPAKKARTLPPMAAPEAPRAAPAPKAKGKGKGKKRKAGSEPRRANQVRLDAGYVPDAPAEDAAPGQKLSFAEIQALKAKHATAAGSREEPRGAPDCLEGVTIVITGDLPNFSREQAEDIVKRHSGKVTSSVSGKTTYGLVGDNPGPSKMVKFAKNKTRLLNEDQFVEIILETLNAGDAPVVTSSFAGGEAAKRPRMGDDAAAAQPAKAKAVPAATSAAAPAAASAAAPAVAPLPASVASSSSAATPASTTPAATTPAATTSAAAASSSAKEPQLHNRPLRPRLETAELWADKYRPTSKADLVGNASYMERLVKWLKFWGRKDSPVPKEDRGFKAALLSGPPGIGKTTMAHLVARMAGMKALELNASDARSKGSLQALLAPLSGTRSMGEFFGTTREPAMKLGKTVVLMDEVDGMSAGDRGGMAELIKLIKSTKVPIICMCNDRTSPKVRSLRNHCIDMNFRRPTERALGARLMHIAQKEGYSITPNVAEHIAKSVNMDVRQALTLLQVWRLNSDTILYDDVKTRLATASKNVRIGLFDIVPKLISSAAIGTPLEERMDYFFLESDLMPLMIQENYLKYEPRRANGDKVREMELIADAADSISESDPLSKSIRMGGNWGLMPNYGVMSSIRPGSIVAGFSSQRRDFPSWLGNNSTAMKRKRLLMELRARMGATASGTKTEVRMDYLPLLSVELCKPLAAQGEAGIKPVCETMAAYNMLREDWDAVFELTACGGKIEPPIAFDQTLKRKMTVEFNKNYAKVVVAPTRLKTGAQAQTAARAGDDDEREPEDGDGDGEEEAEEEDEDDIANDKMIKQKGKAKGKAKGKGKGKGKGKASRKGKEKVGQ